MSSYNNNNDDGRRPTSPPVPSLYPQVYNYNNNNAPPAPPVQGQPVYMHQPPQQQGGYYYTNQPQAQVYGGAAAPPPQQHHHQQHGKMDPMQIQYAQQQQQHQQQQPQKIYNPQSQPIGGKGAGHIDEGDAGAVGKPKYQDLWAAVLFLLHLGLIVYLAVGPGIKALNSKDLTTDSTDNSEPADGSATGADVGLTTLYGGVAVVLAAAAAWSAIWTGILLRNADNIITAAFVGSIASAAVGAILGVVIGNFVLAGMCALMAIIQGMYWYCVRSRIPFAAKNLKCSATAAMQYPSIFVLAFFLTLVQIAWALCWQLATYGVAISKGAEVVVIEGTTFLMSECSTVATNCDCSTETVNGLVSLTTPGTCADVGVFSTSISPLILFGLLISFFWGSLVFKNLLFCSAAGVLADWWYAGNNKSVVSKSFVRSATTSFGSICFGSLILAVIKALREMVKQGRREGQRENAATCILNCILSILDRMMEIFNRYALVYCAVYGNGFVESGRKTCDLFKNCGFTAIINDDLAETALNLVSIVIALLTACVGYVYGIVFNMGDSWPILLAVIGFFSGFFLSLIMMSVLDAGVACTFVVFAEDPEAFSRSHPALHGELVNAWSQIGYDPQRRGITRI